METVFSMPLATTSMGVRLCIARHKCYCHIIFVATNKGIVLDASDVKNHVRKMQHLTVWGTQVELQAAAPLYQVPVHLLTFSKQLHKYSWQCQCYQPWDSSKLNFPETEPLPTRLSNLDHASLERLPHWLHPAQGRKIRLADPSWRVPDMSENSSSY